MKVLDLAEATGSEKSDKKPKNIDLGKIRSGKEKKKKKNTHLFRLIVVLLGVIAAALVWFNADTIFEPLRGIASRIENKTSYDAGFPIELPGSSEYSLQRFGECFSLLTDTYLYAYDTDGAQLYALKHGYNKPMQTTNEKRVLLYDKSAYNFALYSKSSLIYQKTLDDKIVYASVGNDGLAAVVTESDRYSDVLYVYDDGGNWKYTKKFADESVMQVCSVNDSEHIIVSTLSSSNGDIVTSFYKFSTRSTEDYVWKYSVRSNSLPCGMYADKNRVISVCDNSVISLDCANGTLLGNYGYTGELKNFDITADKVLVHYNSISANRNKLLLLNGNAEAVSTANLTAAASCVCSDDSGIYVLDGARIKIFDDSLVTERDLSVTDDDYSSFVKIGRSVYMLGYRTINKAALKEADSE